MGPLTWPVQSGIPTFVRQLVSGLNSTPEAAAAGAGAISFGYYRFSHRGWSPLAREFVTSGLRIAGLPLPMRLARWLWDFPGFLEVAGVKQYDLVVGTVSELPPLAPQQKGLSVFHDLAGFKIPGAFSAPAVRQRRAIYQKTLERSHRILVYSRSTWRDLVELFGVPEEKLRLVPLGIELAPFQKKIGPEEKNRILRKYGISPPFIFFSGIIQPRKNLARLAEAFLSLKEEEKLPHQLVLAGGLGYQGKEILEVIRSQDKSGAIHYTGYVAASDLPLLYQAADLFVYPSLYEGFGLPVVEAMASGTPVVASYSSSIPEVVGQAGVLVDPESPEAIASGMIQVLGNRSLASRLSLQGSRRARQFSHRAMARKFMTVCEELLRA